MLRTAPPSLPMRRAATLVRQFLPNSNPAKQLHPNRTIAPPADVLDFDSPRTTTSSVASKNLDSFLSKHIIISPEVSAALQNGSPVIALESTIISHGMPWPANMECALAVEAAARDSGATPATIAILDGKIHVGLTREELEVLARAGEKCHKCSRRDLAQILASKSHGATTVAGTMYVASLVGISIFVTGGIGGVHRGVETTMDISADLSELGRTPVAVVCAGVKSILDIPRTLEYLETAGVPVAAVGVDEFPAFFTRKSGCQAPLRVNQAAEAARMIQIGQELQMQNGFVFAVPIPTKEEAAAEPIEKATTQALKEADQKKIKGRDITPFLLGRINELTGGASLKSNIALILNNVKFGSAMAVELAKLQQQQRSIPSTTATPTFDDFNSSAPVVDPESPALSVPRFPPSICVPLVIGGTNQDLLGRPSPGSKFLLGTSNPGSLSRCWGGVGRNIAEVLGRLQTQPILITAVGADEQGQVLKRHCASVGIQTDGIVTSKQHATSTYMAILDEKGDLFTTIADMAVADQLQPKLHLPQKAALVDCPLMILDGNISEDMIYSAAQLAYETNTPVCFEPTSIEKCVRIIPSLILNRVTYISPSAAELLAMTEQITHTAGTANMSASGAIRRDAYEHNHSTPAVEQQCRTILTAIAKEHSHANSAEPLRPVHILLKRGVLGCLVASLMPSTPSASSSPPSSFQIHLRHLPIYPLAHLVNTSGAGDTLVGATCAELIRTRATHGRSLDQVYGAVSYGMRAAELTLMSEYSVSPKINRETVDQRQKEFQLAQAAAKTTE